MDNEKIFDDIVSDYDQLLEKKLSQYGKDISYYSEYKIKLLRRKIQKNPLEILEYGCGTAGISNILKNIFLNSKYQEPIYRQKA